MSTNATNTNATSTAIAVAKNAAAAKAAKPVASAKADEILASTAAPEPEPNDSWNMVDGQWVRVPQSQAITASDVNRADPFALPKTLTENHPDYDWMHGGDHPIVMSKSEAQGWAVFQGKVQGAMVKDGASRTLGHDAPIMYRPKAVAHMFTQGPVADPSKAQRESTREVFKELAREINRADRSVNISADELMGFLDDTTEVYDNDPGRRTADAILAQRRMEDAERRGGERSSHFFSLPDKLAESLRTRQRTQAA